MANLNNQLNEITDTAIRLIAANLDKNNGIIKIVDNINHENEENSEDEFYRLVADKTLMFTLYNEYEGNEDLYLLSIHGNETDCTVTATDLYGIEKKTNLFELDAHNLTLIADYILNN